MHSRRPLVCLVLVFAFVALPLVSQQADAFSPASPLAVHDVQGAAHVSPYDGRDVIVTGVVTVVGPRGFYLESLAPDENPATSEGLYVDTYLRPDVEPGDVVTLAGPVVEHYPGGRASGSLPVTTIRRPEIRVEARGRELPAPVVLGSGGRIPPTRVISNDAPTVVEESHFDPDEDGIDFYESLEGMRVVLHDAISVGTVHTRYGEIWVLPDTGAHAQVRTDRGGIVVREGDLNPERILIDYIEDDPIHVQSRAPRPVVGDVFLEPIVGVMTYSWYNYKVVPLSDLPDVRPARLDREVASSVDEHGVLSVAAFNVQNLSAASNDAKFLDIATTIASALAAPDIVLLSEIQDGNGSGRGDLTSSTETARRLLLALRTAGAPAGYRYVDIAPEYNRDGGQPHANIRVGFLYRADRVSLVEGSLRRVAPEASAFVRSRKPLAGQFVFGDQRVHVIGNHFSSKGGDAPLFSRTQPAVAASEARRIAQAQEVHRYVASVLADDPGAHVIVGGDLNDFAFSRAVRALAGDLLWNPADELPDSEVYSYVYEGNSQALDHILLSRSLAGRLAEPLDYVHRYAEYLYDERHSDHDPVLVRIRF